MLSLLLAILSYIIQLLPYCLCRNLAKIIGDLLFYGIRIRRKVVLENLQQALGTKYNKKELCSIARKTYFHYALFLLEFIRLSGQTPEELKKKLYINGMEHFNLAYSQKRGIVFISGHIGFWELGAAAITSHGYPASVYARSIHNPAVNRWINSIRESHNIRIISKRFLLRDIIRELHDEKTVCFLFDQDAGDNGIFVDFLGRPASTYKGPAFCAIKANSPILPAFMIHGQGETYQVFLHPAIYPDLQKPLNQEMERITRDLSKLLESYVYQYPDQYFWFHRRWKTLQYEFLRK